MTTERRLSGFASLWRGPRFSVRTRITVSIGLLTALALTVAGVAVYALEAGRVRAATSASTEQEVAEFRQLQQGTDPATGRPFTDPNRLVELFLERNVPDDDEMLVAYDGVEPVAVSGVRGEGLLDDPRYRRAVGDLLDSGGSQTVSRTSHGNLQLTVVPVRNRSTSAALVIVRFLDRTEAALRETLRTYAVVAALALLLITAVAATQSGRLLAPLRALRRTAEEISATDLTRRIPEEDLSRRDDLFDLARTVNGMLDRLEAGFDAQRRFLDDVGHELRTPLTVIAGHLELMDPARPAEVADTRALALEETDRMARLVGDLILLAKSRRPDFLDLRPVNLSELTASIVAKARALGRRDWQVDAAGTGKVVVDAQRLTQAMLALADNAVKHTRDGDEVRLGSSYDGAVVRLWVSDTGAGVPAEDRELIFDRFGRSRRAPDDEGFGLGLSIVRAIAAAHGGRATVREARPGQTPPGALFEVEVPAGPPASSPDNPQDPAGKDR